MAESIYSKKGLANWVTLFRIISVVFPCWLILEQPKPTLDGPPENILIFAIGLIAFTIIGVTDYIDGYLARKYGSTDFGKFLDPLSDKIFTLATFLSIAQFGLVPFWPVPFVLIRETAITELRSLASVARAELKTSNMGKYKTNVQGWGCGGILLHYILWDNLFVFEAIVGTVGIILTVLGIWSWIRNGKLSPAWVIGAGSVDFNAIARLFLPTYQVIMIFWIFIMLITVYSGLEYLAIAFNPIRNGLSASNKKRITVTSILNSFISVMGPLFPAIIGLIDYTWAAFAISFELAMLGIENHLAMTGHPLPFRMKLFKLGLQVITAGCILLVITTNIFHNASVFAWMSLVPSVVFGLVYIVRYAPHMSFTGESQEE